jgi:hypothetical protein
MFQARWESHDSTQFRIADEADKRFLIKRIKRIVIHSQLESTRDSAVKFSQPRQLLPNSNSARNEDVSNCTPSLLPRLPRKNRVIWQLSSAVI